MSGEGVYLVDAGGICEIDRLPPVDIAPQTQVHVFDSGSALPAANSIDGISPPDSCTAFTQRLETHPRVGHKKLDRDRMSLDTLVVLVHVIPKSTLSVDEPIL